MHLGIETIAVIVTVSVILSVIGTIEKTNQVKYTKTKTFMQMLGMVTVFGINFIM